MIQPITVFNRSSLASNADLANIMYAINNVSMPAFAARWGGLQAMLMLEQPAGAWPMWILDNADVPGDLAYHFFQGVPQIRGFAQTIASYGESLCKALDHEVKETLKDPSASQTIPYKGTIALDEVCDPVSADDIDLGSGLVGANFIYPSWMQAGAAGPYDELGLCTAPFEVRPGGYVEHLDAGKWVLTAMRGANDLPSWRTQHHGRLVYRARNRNGNSG